MEHELQQAYEQSTREHYAAQAANYAEIRAKIAQGLYPVVCVDVAYCPRTDAILRSPWVSPTGDNYADRADAEARAAELNAGLTGGEDCHYEVRPVIEAPPRQVPDTSEDLPF